MDKHAIRLEALHQMQRLVSSGTITPQQLVEGAKIIETYIIA